MIGIHLLTFLVILRIEQTVRMVDAFELKLISQNAELLFAILHYLKMEF